MTVIRGPGYAVEGEAPGWMEYSPFQSQDTEEERRARRLGRPGEIIRPRAPGDYTDQNRILEQQLRASEFNYPRGPASPAPRPWTGGGEAPNYREWTSPATAQYQAQYEAARPPAPAYQPPAVPQYQPPAVSAYQPAFRQAVQQARAPYYPSLARPQQYGIGTGRRMTPAQLLQSITRRMRPRTYLNMGPTRRDFLSGLVSGLGMPPEDYWQRIERGFPGGPDPSRISFGNF